MKGLFRAIKTSLSVFIQVAAVSEITFPRAIPGLGRAQALDSKLGPTWIFMGPSGGPH